MQGNSVNGRGDEPLLLIGSLPSDSTEEALRTFGPQLGKYLPAIPDGETGDRSNWTQRLSYQVFNGHPELEIIARPAPDADGVEVLRPRNRQDFWRFRVKPGVSAVRFGDKGWRLGFARAALDSYFIFKTLREKGVLPADLRFQVSMPIVGSVIRPATFPEPGDIELIYRGYEQALCAEIEVILTKIPAGDLAFQWDLATEVIEIYNQPSPAEREKAIARHTPQVQAVSSIVPEEIPVGIHFCFGTFGGWPVFNPPDLGAVVDLANASLAIAGRQINWIHIPTTDTTDESFYAPLERLDSRGARVYLGMIHNMATFSQRFAVARRFVSDFGIAAYCGHGRMSRDVTPALLQDYHDAIRIMNTNHQT